MFRLHRLPVFIRAKQREIQAIARIGEIVRVAAERRDRLFRRENEPHVGVFFVLVKIVLTARVSVTTSHRLPVALLHADSSFVMFACRIRFASAGGVASVTPSFTFAVTVSIRNRMFTSRSGHAFSSPFGPRLEAIFHVVMLFGADFVNALSAHMMVCE